MSPDEERAATLWTLHVLPDGGFELYVSCLLGPAFGPQQTTISESYADEKMGTERLDGSRQVYAELAGRFPEPPEPRTFRGLPIKIESRLHISHVVDAWPNHPPAHLIRLTREVINGSEGEPLRVEVAVEALSMTGRRAVHVLDEFALAQSRRFVDRHGARLVGQPVPDAAPPKPWRVFISYRSRDREIAAQLHGALTAYGGSAFFDPYLDAHDLAAGELEQRLMEEVDRADLFVALALDDYGDPRSWSRRELERALARGTLIVPVVIGDATPQHWQEWKQYVAHRLSGAAAIAVESTEFGSLAKMMVLGAMRERPR